MREGAHAELGGVVTAAAGVRLDAGDRADHHNVAVAAGLQRRHRRTGGAHGAEHVGLDIHCQSASDDDSMGSRPAAPPALFTRTGIGHLGHEAFHGGGIGDVELDGPPAGGVGHLTQPVETPGAEHDAEPLLGEAIGRCCADSARRTGHHRHTPVHGSTVSRPSSGPAPGAGRSFTAAEARRNDWARVTARKHRRSTTGSGSASRAPRRVGPGTPCP